MPKSERRGRRSGPNATRSAILSCANAAFSRRGYNGTTIVAIAADAGVDAALVHHYFKTKRALFETTLAIPDPASSAIISALAGAQPGEALVHAFLTAWDASGDDSGFAGLARTAATEPATQRRLVDLIASTLVAPAAAAISSGATLPKLRASLVAAQLAGLAWMRYVLRIDPIASASPHLLAKTLGPSIAKTLDGTV